MKIVTEQDVIGLIYKITGNSTKINVSNSLIDMGIVSCEQMKQILIELGQMYSLEINPDADFNKINSVITLVEYTNSFLGLNDYTIRSMFLDICSENNGQNAIDFDNRIITYTELKEIVESLAANMNKLDICKGTKVAIILSNRLEYILSYFSLFYIGALPVPINIRWSKQEVFNVLDDAECEFIICEEIVGNITYGEYVSEYSEKSNLIKKVIYFDKDLYGEKGILFDSLLEKSCYDSIEYENIYAGDVAMISYTSGTTGTPKGVMLTHNNIVKISEYTAKMWGDEDDNQFSIAPLYSAQGFLSLFINFAFEKCFKMISSFNPNDILMEISKCKHTMIHTQPTMWTLLLNCRIINFTKFDSLRKLVVSGSLCSPELSKRIEEKLGCELLNAYGLIEGTSVVTMTRCGDAEDVRFNTVGRVIPGAEIKIVDPDRKPVPHGEIGELAVRGYNMIGYYNNPSKTAEVFDADGWLYTGDLARYYDEENISIVGRCKDMIIRGGFNVYPSDIEEYILQMPQVQTAAVVGKIHEILGEEIVAFIVIKAGETLKKSDVLSYLFSKIANYKLPDKIYFISEMPIILAGKIDKKVLSEWLINGIPSEKQILFD
jgi:fatty-acyl-CoA synthase